MRNFLAGLLILAGGLATFPAAVALWQQRVLMDEERFVAAAEDVLREDAVQEALAQRIAKEVVGLLPPAAVASPALTDDLVQPRAREVIERLLEGSLLDAALRGTHRTLVRVIETDAGARAAADETIVIDFGPLIEAVLDDLRRRPALTGPRIEAPEAAGRIRLARSEDIESFLRPARLFDLAAPYLVALPAALFVAVILIARSRSAAAAFAGIIILATAGLRILVLQSAIEEPLIEAALLDPAARQAARATVDILAGTLVGQELPFLLVGGVLLAAGLLFRLPSRGEG